MTRWRPALRMARRDLWAHKGRSLLMACLVALPVLVAVTVAQVHHHSQWEGERAARSAMGGADAVVEVTAYDRVRVDYWPTEMLWTPVGRDGSARGNVDRMPRDDRDAAHVDLAGLLPPGSRVLDSLRYGSVTLDTGGTGYVKVMAADDPMARGLADVSAGRAPTGTDEVAVSAAAAAALDLVDDGGDPRPDATLGLLDGTQLSVVGIIDPRGAGSYQDGIELLAAPGSLVADRAFVGDEDAEPASARRLLDLPDTSPATLHRLVDELAAQGVAMMPRDAVLHPRDWNAQGAPSAVDATALAIGALVVLFGLAEVVLLVGSAFAVGARRQVRDLGLVAANGGAARDVRTVLLAQGLVLGVGASLVGAAAGLVLFRLGVPAYEALAHTRIWTRDVEWVSVVGLVLLGSTTGVVAALAPAWSISRMSAVDALSGQFSTSDGEARAHRPAVLLAVIGLLVVVASGWWIAAEYAEGDATATPAPLYAVPPSTVPVVIGAVGLLALLIGLVWLAPHLVHRASGAAKHLSVSGRLAVREATRHRFRTAASAITLMITVAGTVFAGFAVQAVSAQLVGEVNELGARWMSVEVGSADPDPVAAERRVERTMDAVLDQVGPARTYVSSAAVDPAAAPYSEPYLGTVVEPGSFVQVVDRDTLGALVGADAEVLAVFDDGGVVTASSGGVRGDRARVTFDPPGRTHDDSWALPAAVAEPTALGRGLGSAGAWISRETAATLGFVPVPATIAVVAERDISPDDLDALGVQGIYGSSMVRELEQVGLLQIAALGGAGLLTLLVIGIAVALSSAEGRADQATMAAIGAGPGRRRLVGAMHGTFIGVVGTVLGTLVGLPAGAALMQVDGAQGTSIPWLVMLGLPLVPALAWLAGWVATSTNLTLVRRTS